MNDVLATPQDATGAKHTTAPVVRAAMEHVHSARSTCLRLILVGTLLSALFGCRGPAEDRVCTHMLDVLGSTDVLSCTASM